MSTPKNKTKAQREEQLTRISELHLKRWPAYRIAQELGLSRQTVQRDLAIIRKRYQEAQIDNLHLRRARELAKINLVDREAWSAWDRSKEDAETWTQKIKKAGGPGNPVEVSIRTKGQAGDATYLKTVLECIRHRCGLLGLYAPTRHILGLQDMTDEELDAELARLKAEDRAEGAPSAHPKNSRS